MVGLNLAPKWSPRGLWQRWRRAIRRPGDVSLALRIGFFIWRAPARLDRTALPAFLAELRAARRPGADDLGACAERVARLQNVWLRLPCFRARDGCYLRTLIFYRFLDPAGRDVRVHFVVEPAEREGERLKGHAWLTVDGRVLGGLPPGLEARTHRIYTFPPVANG